MAKRIANVKEAIESGEIPGTFTEDRTTFEYPVLEYPGSRGTPLQWSIKVTLLGAGGKPAAITDEMLDQPVAVLPKGYKAEITTIACQKGGKVRDVLPTYVTQGKALNKTNAITQALREAASKYDHKKRTAQAEEQGPEEHPQKDKTPARGDQAVTGRDLRPLPMLVNKEGATRDSTLTPADFMEGVIIQKKLNGVRAIMYTDPTNSTVACYSRTGIDYPCQKTILDEMREIAAVAPVVQPGEYGTKPTLSKELTEAYARPYFDGEIYKHGEALNWISGQARRGNTHQEKDLQYHVFDVFFPYAIALGEDMPSEHRQAYLSAAFSAASKLGHPHIVRVENEPIHSLTDIKARMKDYLKEGYEGAIARKARAGYRYSDHNYHSSGLLKFKPIFDSEFAVIGYTQGTRGKDVGAVVWICEVPNAPDPRDKTFNVVPKDMTYDMRYAIYSVLSEKDKDGKTRFDKDIKGLPMTLEYQETNLKTGKPLRAKALAFRSYERKPGETSEDPVASLYEDAEHLVDEKKATGKPPGRPKQTARKATGGKLPRQSHASAQARRTVPQTPQTPEPVVFTREELEAILGDVPELSEPVDFTREELEAILGDVLEYSEEL